VIGLASAFGRIPLRWKVVVIMLGVAAISLVLAGAGLLLYERAGFERETERKLVLLADVIGLNSTAALAFKDVAAGTETLAALSSDEHVVAAALYDTKGGLFARYLRRGADHSLPESAPPLSNATFGDGEASLVRTIVLRGQPVGKMYLLADTTGWSATMWGFIGILAILFVAVLVVGLFVSIWLQRLITDPIAELAQLTRRIGQERDYTLRAVPHTEDELGVLVHGFNDMLDEIGKRRGELERAHHELYQLNEQLEQRVHVRTEQLEIANKELEAFSYSVSHDLRAPLRAIDGFSRILLDDHGAALDAGAHDCLDRVRNAAQRMSMLIDDLLMLARVTRAEAVRAEVDFSALARQVADALQAQNPDRRVRFALTPGLKVHGDARLLRIALENLFENAWKFTGGRTEASIEFGMKSEDSTPVYFVRDNGAGFDMTYAGKLFTPFQRLHMAEEFPGTGIGLATVQRIIHKHNGRIWAEGAVDQGATFYFRVG
jgi:signal transduction histidine kinase